jgi:hypothetical protein
VISYNQFLHRCYDQIRAGLPVYDIHFERIITPSDVLAQMAVTQEAIESCMSGVKSSDRLLTDLHREAFDMLAARRESQLRRLFEVKSNEK